MAIPSAFVAYRTRRQSRVDLFETQRDLLLLSAAENNARLRTIQFEADILATQIRGLAMKNEDAMAAKRQRLLDGLSGLASVLGDLQRREWTPSQIQSASFSEDAILSFRKYTLAEQVTARTLQTDAHQILLQEARGHLKATSAA